MQCRGAVQGCKVERVRQGCFGGELRGVNKRLEKVLGGQKKQRKVWGVHGSVWECVGVCGRP